ncbi:hypothetical protein EJB05_26606 [Eragrostis curvula]|uniref:Uncharacterized protein n=1 Tax=Eragrostis curvula TaxID=38414 RepID=A0A5J9UL76_9POAL|nr:hypothetical protein EJB05_26606 [Eragrostis curvula]
MKKVETNKERCHALEHLRLAMLDVGKGKWMWRWLPLLYHFSSIPDLVNLGVLQKDAFVGDPMAERGIDKNEPLPIQSFIVLNGFEIHPIEFIGRVGTGIAPGERRREEDRWRYA